MLLPVRTIGQNIKTARLAANIKTQGALARRIGVPQPQMSDWENDRYGAPDTKSLVKIAAGIGCHVNDLVRGTNARYDPDTAEVLVEALPVQLSVPLWQELTALWDKMSVANHESLLSVVRSFAHVKPPAEAAEPAGKRKVRPTARRSR